MLRTVSNTRCVASLRSCAWSLTTRTVANTISGSVVPATRRARRTRSEGLRSSAVLSAIRGTGSVLLVAAPLGMNFENIGVTNSIASRDASECPRLGARWASDLNRPRRGGRGHRVGSYEHSEAEDDRQSFAGFRRPAPRRPPPLQIAFRDRRVNHGAQFAPQRIGARRQHLGHEDGDQLLRGIDPE